MSGWTIEQAGGLALIAVALGVAAVGLLAHLCWLAVTDRGELGEFGHMFWEVVAG
jgi:hypothetical protein